MVHVVANALTGISVVWSGGMYLDDMNRDWDTFYQAPTHFHPFPAVARRGARQQPFVSDPQQIMIVR